MAPGYGYTCGPVFDVDPNVSPVIGGRREEQALSKCFKSMYIYNKVTFGINIMKMPTVSHLFKCIWPMKASHEASLFLLC